MVRQNQVIFDAVELLYLTHTMFVDFYDKFKSFAAKVMLEKNSIYANKRFHKWKSLQWRHGDSFPPLISARFDASQAALHVYLVVITTRCKLLWRRLHFEFRFSDENVKVYVIGSERKHHIRIFSSEYGRGLGTLKKKKRSNKYIYYYSEKKVQILTFSFRILTFFSEF